MSFTDNWFLFLSPQVQLYTCGLNQLGSLGIGTADLDPPAWIAGWQSPPDPITRLPSMIKGASSGGVAINMAHRLAMAEGNGITAMAGTTATAINPLTCH